jgi:hypothetical protein
MRSESLFYFQINPLQTKQHAYVLLMLVFKDEIHKAIYQKVCELLMRGLAHLSIRRRCMLPF